MDGQSGMNSPGPPRSANTAPCGSRPGTARLVSTPIGGAIEALGADVLVVQECGPRTPAQAADHDGWTCEWQAGGWDKGLAVLGLDPPNKIETREASEPFFVSTVISGPDRFRFVGFWAMTPKFARYEYPQQATRLIEQLPDDGLPTVVAGDFNASKSQHHLSKSSWREQAGEARSRRRSFGVPFVSYLGLLFLGFCAEPAASPLLGDERRELGRRPAEP